MVWARMTCWRSCAAGKAFPESMKRLAGRVVEGEPPGEPIPGFGSAGASPSRNIVPICEESDVLQYSAAKPPPNSNPGDHRHKKAQERTKTAPPLFRGSWCLFVASQILISSQHARILHYGSSKCIKDRSDSRGAMTFPAIDAVLRGPQRRKLFVNPATVARSAALCSSSQFVADQTLVGWRDSS